MDRCRFGFILFLLSCSSPPTPVFAPAERVAEVEAHLASLAAAMEARDAERVMAHYARDSTFLVTVDGATYSTFDSLRADVRRGYGMFEAVEMAWGDFDVALVTPGVAAVTAPYTQRTTMTSGDPWNTMGIWSGLLVRTDQGWRIVRVHQQTLP